MITLYTGTPGSGKSMHMARLIMYKLRHNVPVIANFKVNADVVGRQFMDNFFYLDNTQLSADVLMDFSRYYFKDKPLKEDSIILFIDECQMLFNARQWNIKGRDKWNEFFQLHRHYGFEIILVSQFDTMIDKQLRSLVEYQVIHRKMSNFGWKGKFLCALFLSPKLFVYVRVWYPLQEKVGTEMVRFTKKYVNLYNTYLNFKGNTETTCSLPEVFRSGT